MKKNQKSNIVINAQDDVQVNVALNNGKIEAQQINSRDKEKVKRSHYFSNRKNLCRFLIIIGSVAITSLLCLKFYDKYLEDDTNSYNRALIQKAYALEIEGKYLEAVAIYNELYGRMLDTNDYRLEYLEFLEARDYFYQFMFGEGAENKYRYKAIEIFEKIVKTKYEENEDIKLMSMACLILICNDLNDENIEKEMADYCKVLEEAMIKYNISSTEDYNICNLRLISYFAMGEFYGTRVERRFFEKDISQYLTIVFYYQEALKNCRAMMKYDQFRFSGKRFEIVLLKRLATYDSCAYLITKDNQYLLNAEICFDEIRGKVDVDEDLPMYIDCMITVAEGKILIGNEESLEEGYKILNSLAYHICKDEDQSCEIAQWMILSGLATEADIKYAKEHYSCKIEKLEKENNIQEYVNMVYQTASSYWYLTYYYQDREAYDEGYSYLLDLQNGYLDLVECSVKNDILMLIKDYESYLEY